jgi:hypothetical protein
VLMAAAGGHAGLMAAILVIAALVIGAVVTIVLVSLVNKEDRVDAIHAVAEVLTALLPWSGRREGGALGRRRAR